MQKLEEAQTALLAQREYEYKLAKQWDALYAYDGTAKEEQHEH